MLEAGLVNNAIPAGLCTLLIVAAVICAILWLIGLVRYRHPAAPGAVAPGWHSYHHGAGVAAVVLCLIWLLFC